MPEFRSQSVRADLEAPASPEDPLHLPGGKRAGTADRCARAVLQAAYSLLSEASQPLVSRSARHPERLGRSRDRPAVLENARDEQQTAERRQPGPSMDHESLLPVRDSDSPNRERRLSSVNNLGGNYN